MITVELTMKQNAMCIAAILFSACCASSHADEKAELSQLRERIENLQRDIVKSEESRNEVADG